MGRKSAMLSWTAGLLAAATVQGAVIVNFDDYAAGELVGQPSAPGSKWTGVSGMLNVVDAAGGGREIVVTATANASNTVSLIPTAAEQGGAPGTPTERQTFSFDYRVVATDSPSAELFRLWLGTSTADHAVEINFRRNDVKLNSSATTLASGLTLGGTYTISGLIDYTAKRYDIAIHTSGGTLLNSLSGRAFDGLDPTAYSGFRLNTRDSGANDRIAFDNMTLAVPEPASLGLLGLAGIASLRRRRTN